MKTIKAVWTSLQICADTAVQIGRSYRPSADLTDLKHEWAARIFNRLSMELEIIGQPSRSPSILFLGNHLSYLDIPMLLFALPEVSFVAKKEIQRWPLFGQGARAMNTVFVDREDSNNRAQARKTIALELEQGKRIVLFPSGTTCLNESKEWRRGPFEIARTHAAFVQPFRIRYSPSRVAAYIDDDFFPFHLLNLIAKGPIRATLEFHPPVAIEDAEQGRLHWQEWARSAIDEPQPSGDISYDLRLRAT